MPRSHLSWLQMRPAGRRGVVSKGELEGSCQTSSVLPQKLSNRSNDLALPAHHSFPTQIQQRIFVATIKALETVDLQL